MNSDLCPECKVKRRLPGSQYCSLSCVYKNGPAMPQCVQCGIKPCQKDLKNGEISKWCSLNCRDKSNSIKKPVIRPICIICNTNGCWISSEEPSGFFKWCSICCRNQYYKPSPLFNPPPPINLEKIENKCQICLLIASIVSRGK